MGMVDKPREEDLADSEHRASVVRGGEVFHGPDSPDAEDRLRLARSKRRHGLKSALAGESEFEASDAGIPQHRGRGDEVLGGGCPQDCNYRARRQRRGEAAVGRHFLEDPCVIYLRM
jgi:hypothetical protein